MKNGGVVRVKAENVIIGEEDNIAGLSGKAVKITVSDQGAGISEEHISKIFDPYFSTKESGSGLGLAMVYSIVKNHGGHIKVDSKVGKGAKISVYLPASDGVKEIEVSGLEELKSGKGRILIMDDDSSVREVAGTMLIHLGYTVDYASDGAEALFKYARSLENDDPYGLVIMDLTIPGGMGGLEAMDRLKEIDPRVCAVVSSGYSNDRIISDYSKHGFKGVITKPYKIEDLGKVVHDILIVRGSFN